jgi:hypothetical protein
VRTQNTNTRMLIPRVAQNENETVARQKDIKLSFINKKKLGEKIKNFNNFSSFEVSDPDWLRWGVYKTANLNPIRNIFKPRGF